MLQQNEECEVGGDNTPIRSDGSRGLPAGTPFNEWNCDPETCERRFVDTPCSEVGWNVSDCPSGFCDGKTCQPVDAEHCEAWAIAQPIVDCEIEGIWAGLCGLDRCFPTCESDTDCPSNTTCQVMYQGYPDRACR